MSAPAVPAGTPRLLPYHLDHAAWAACLRGALMPPGQWRPGEFDAARWLFTGDPGNPMTTSARCRVARCETVIASRSMCGPCRRALAVSGLGKEEFGTTYQPALAHQRLAGAACVVARDGAGCQRRRRSNQTGLCQAHGNMWNRSRPRAGLTLEQWCAQAARPLPARPGCAVAGCARDAKADGGLCGGHEGAWRAGQAQLPPGLGEDAQRWAARQPGPLRGHQFSLAVAGPTVRWELLYALQQRDIQGQRLDPAAVRALVSAVTGLDALAITPYQEVAGRAAGTASVRAYARLACRIIALKFEEFRGITHTGKEVWDCLALDLAAPRPGKRPNRSVVDFTLITQPWLKEAAKQWVATASRDTGTLRRTLQAATLASAALSRRPGGGQQPCDAGPAELAAVFEAINTAAGAAGQLYSSHFRRSLWARLWEMIDLGRAAGTLDELPAAFTRRSCHRIAGEQANEDAIGKAVPEMVIAQLDACLHLLGTDHNYGRVWSAADTAAMFRAAYEILRDTGRRPGEVVSLAAGCLEADGGEYALVYDNHKQRRLRRRLPVTTGTAAAIQRWQQHRAGLDLPASARRWLFPACNESSGPGHLTTIRLASALRSWVAAIPVLHSDLPGPGGIPVPFDRSLIYPYAFRHSYAQRHADAGVSVEILQVLMDHKDMAVTQGYYTVSLKRKREAIKIMSRYVQDRAGAPCPQPGPAASYELKSVAVPFGNCTEPANVKAGGKGCPIRFQCAGCGFYRPDPSYLPAIESHINALKADRETALAMDADDFVVRNLTDQAEAFTAIAASMRDRLRALPASERAEVEQASALLRKLRASTSHPLLPLTVKDRP